MFCSLSHCFLWRPRTKINGAQFLIRAGRNCRCDNARGSHNMWEIEAPLCPGVGCAARQSEVSPVKWVPSSCAQDAVGITSILTKIRENTNLEFYWRQSYTGMAWLAAFAASFVPQCLVAALFLHHQNGRLSLIQVSLGWKLFLIFPSFHLSSIPSSSPLVLGVLAVPCRLLSHCFKVGSQA